MGVVCVAETGVAVLFEEVLDAVANFGGVGDATEDAYVGGHAGLTIAAAGGEGAGTAGGVDLQVGVAEQAFEWPLIDGQVLDVGIGEGGFADIEYAFADAEAAVGDDVVTHIVVEPDEEVTADHGGEGVDAGDEEDPELKGGAVAAG